METKEKQKPVTYVSGLGYLPATPKLTERRNLAMRYHLVILSTMLVLGLWLVLLPPFRVLASHLGFSSWEGELMARIFTLLCAYFPASLILWLCGDRSKGVVGVKKAIGIRYGYALGIGLGMSALARLLTAGGLWLMSVTTPFYYEQETAPQPEGFGGLILELAALVLLPALLEEFFFRGLVMGRLKEFGELVSVLVSCPRSTGVSAVFRTSAGAGAITQLFSTGAHSSKCRSEPSMALPGLVTLALLYCRSAAAVANRDGLSCPLVR